MPKKSAAKPHISARHMSVKDQLPEPHQTPELVFFTNYLRNMLIYVVLGIISGALDWNPNVVSILNVFATTLLAYLWSFTTGELAVALGHTLSWLWKASFVNFTEAIVSCCTSQSMFDVANHGVVQFSLRPQEQWDSNRSGFIGVWQQSTCPPRTRSRPWNFLAPRGMAYHARAAC